jgi:hypothetical protein
MSELLTNRFIAISQSINTNVLSKSRSRYSRAAQDVTHAACQADTAFTEKWTDVKNLAVQRANEEHVKWQKNGRYINETSADARPMLKAYWRTLGITPTNTQLGDSEWQKDNFWSAAFISYIMHEAGAGSSFAYSIRHMHYVYAAKQNALNKDLDNPFWLCNVTDTVPEPGDIVCMNRGRGFTYDRVAPRGSSHCDIVVSVDHANGRMTVIGGNKQGDTVRAVTIRLNDDGTVNTSRHRDVYAIIKLRTDRCDTCGT